MGDGLPVSIGRNAGWNLLGGAVPLLVNIAAVPIYLHLAGVERYGALALCWILLGYAGFLELGLGPAVTQRISASSAERSTDIPGFFWTALWISSAMGVVGAVLIFWAVRLYFGGLAEVGHGIAREAIEAAPLIALAVPVVMLTSVMIGALQAMNRFAAMNLLTMLGSVLGSLLPLAAFLWWPSLAGLVAGALGGRLFTLALFILVAARSLPIGNPQGPSSALAMPLLRFGGWITLASLATPLLATIDRLAIGIVLGTAAVAAYSIPLGLLGRLTLISSSISGALFPRFARTDAHERARLVGESLLTVAVLMTPAVLALLALIDIFLRLWLGSALAAQSAPIAHILCVGIWFGSFAPIFQTFLHGTARPDLVSKLLVAEIVPYWLLIFWAASGYGLLGVGVVWTARATWNSLILGRLAGIGRDRLSLLAAPAALVLASSLAAAALEGPARYVAQALLLGLGLLWAAFHIPPSLRTRLSLAPRGVGS